MYAKWFQKVTRHAQPHAWQLQLGEAKTLADRLIRIPTGFGKTIGIALAWYFDAVVNGRPDWPRRLLWCLPSRVLVEQTADVLRELFATASAVDGDGQGDRAAEVFVLLGGEDPRDWHLSPDRPAALVGTQEMLLSRALGRGYGSGRARWPIELGMLNQDCLWVIDEVQLHGVGLPTSVQLQTFRADDAAGKQALRPAATWWMSATLQPDWLSTVDFDSQLPRLREEMLQIAPSARKGSLWEATKPCALLALPGKPAKTAKQWAERVLAEHGGASPGHGRTTLVILNRVESAIAIHQALAKALKSSPDAPELRLVHSRFRGRERKKWSNEFLSRQANEAAGTNRIIVATQVVEAGVDVSATALISELAPWASLVQRFGRAARYGGTARITVIDPQLAAKDALPYDQADLDAAREAIGQLKDVSLSELERFEDQLPDNPELLGRLYRFQYIHLLTRRECDELFDTTPDLSGADLDVGRFIREGDDRDVSVCWFKPDWDWAETDRRPPPDRQPLRDALCPVPIGAAQSWLLDNQRTDKIPAPHHAWFWDYVDSVWQPLKRKDQLAPGRLLLVDARYGGYVESLGFTGTKPSKADVLDVTDVLSQPNTNEAAMADQGQLREDLTLASANKTIATHGREAAEDVDRLARLLHLPPEVSRVLNIAARWHDWGKSHAVFQGNVIRTDGLAQCGDLAKADNWLDYRHSHYNWPERRGWADAAFGKRRGFRHELASMLGILELLAWARPDHPAILGDVAPLLELMTDGANVIAREPPPEHSLLIEELAALPSEQFNLLLYLVCSHHGKVRGGLQATPHDQEFNDADPSLVGAGMPICGVREGDPLPGVRICDATGECVGLPSVTLHLDAAAIGVNARYGRSWSERVDSLVDRWGIFSLAYLEAILRAADVAASRRTTDDPLLKLEAVR